MNRSLKMVVIMAFCMGAPIMGVMSFHFCQLGNWLLTYLTSGLSFAFPIFAWIAFGIKEEDV